MESLETRAKVEEQSVFNPIVENEFNSFDRIFKKLSKKENDSKVVVDYDRDGCRILSFGSLSILKGNLNGQNYISYKVKTDEGDIAIAYLREDMFDSKKKDAQFYEFDESIGYHQLKKLVPNAVKGTVRETLESNLQETIGKNPMLGKFETMILSDIKTIEAEDPDRKIIAPTEEQRVIADLQSRNMQLNEQVKQNIELTSQNEELTAQNKELTEQNAELAEQNRKLVEELEKTKAQRDQAQSFLSANQQKLTKVMEYLKAKHPLLSKRFKDDIDGEQK